MGHCEVVVEGGKLRVFGKYARDVVRIYSCGGGKEGKRDSEGEEREVAWHCGGRGLWKALKQWGGGMGRIQESACF